MENSALAVNTIFVGIVVVFLALIVLSYSIYLLKVEKLFTRKKGEKVNSDDMNLVSDNDYAEEETICADSCCNNNDELAAVIAAAVMASIHASPGSKIIVRSFRRIPQLSPAWQSAGRAEQLAGKL